MNPVTEEEPGRILHEMRFGESAELSLGGGRIYYGSVDATPLFVMLLGELQRWGNRREEVDALLPAADRALGVDRRVRRPRRRRLRGVPAHQRPRAREPGLEGLARLHAVRRRSARGRAGRAVRGAGLRVRRARSPARTSRPKPATRSTRPGSRRGPGELKERFNRDFWLEERGWLAMGLDRDKQPLDALTSNMGHCLWTGILDEDKAAIVGRAPRVGRHVLGVGHPHARHHR